MTEQTQVAYVAPTVEKIGDFESTTLHAVGGSSLDATFPGGTPASSLTFS